MCYTLLLCQKAISQWKNMYRLWQKYYDQRWRRKHVFWIKSRGLSCPAAFFAPSNLTSWTTPGRKRVGIRVMLVQMVWGCSWLMSGRRKKELDKIGLRLAKQHKIRDCCAHSDPSPPQHLGWSCCTQCLDRVLSRQSAEPQLDKELKKLSVQTQSKCFPNVKLLMWRCRQNHHHQLVATTQIQKMHFYLYVYFNINNFIYVL